MLIAVTVTAAKLKKQAAFNLELRRCFASVALIAFWMRINTIVCSDGLQIDLEGYDMRYG